jgi:hypothetical protein
MPRNVTSLESLLTLPPAFLAAYDFHGIQNIADLLPLKMGRRRLGNDPDLYSHPPNVLKNDGAFC